MAVHDTVENNRTEYTAKTLESLFETVDYKKHKIVFVDNGSCEETKSLLVTGKNWYGQIVITNNENLGTAKAINKGILLRRPGEHVIKMDNDVVIKQKDWVEKMELAIERMNSTVNPVGIVGLKRKDLAERPDRTDWAHSELIMTPSKTGERWLVLEKVPSVMGTCQMINSNLLDKIGGFYQMDGVYGFDDTALSVRSTLAGFGNYFIPEIEIEHIDKGGDEYCAWKKAYAGEMFSAYNQLIKDYKTGKRSIYHNPNES